MTTISCGKELREGSRGSFLLAFWQILGLKNACKILRNGVELAYKW